MLTFFLCALMALQEKPPAVPEKIMLKIPDFYFTSQSVSSYRKASMYENPAGDTRKYFIQRTDGGGVAMGEFKEVPSKEFEEAVQGLIGYGVRDSQQIDLATPNLNPGYRDAMQSLMGYGLVSKAMMQNISNRYRDLRWFESLYWADEACPGVFNLDGIARPDGELQIPTPGDGGDFSYFRTLIAIKESEKSPEALLEIRLKLDKAFEAVAVGFVTEWQMAHNAACYAELVRHGVTLTDAVLERLFSGYLASSFMDQYSLVEFFRVIGLPLPPKKLAEEVLSIALKRTPMPGPKIVTVFRTIGVSLPTIDAVYYRDQILEKDGLFEDLEYLIKQIGEIGITIETWKRYGDSAFSWWYGSADARKFQRDTGDWYHAAVESYRRTLPVQREVEAQRSKLAAKRVRTADDDALDKSLEDRLKLIGIGPSRLKGLIGESDNPANRKDMFSNFSIRMRDLISALKMNGVNPDDPFIADKLDARANAYEMIPSGVYKDLVGRMIWRIDDFGRPLLPHREKLELAAYRGDYAALRMVVSDIVANARQSLLDEGEAFIREAVQRYECPIDYETHRKELESSDSPAYAVIEALINHCQAMDFKDGLYVLAQRLHDISMDSQARRVFHLAGLGKEADEKYYNLHDAKYWQAREARFNYEMRVHGQFDNSK